MSEEIVRIGDTPLSISTYSVESKPTKKNPAGTLEIIFCLKGSVRFTYAYEDFGLQAGEFIAVDRDAYYLYKGKDNLCVSFIIDLMQYEERYPYIKDMHVSARIYQIEESFGAFAAVDDIYSGLIPKREMTGRERLGEVCTLRVTGVREDGKLDLSAREAAYKMMEEDSENVLSLIRDEYNGVLPFDDKASPDQIRDIFGLSKAAFKRAVGKLYRERLIRLEDGRIFISEEN